jgi:four helix bundle protein
MVKHFRELRVYQDAFAAAMTIFQLSKSWPQEERYSLTDQIRRASRSASTNIAEAWRKRRYPAHFTSKLSDADSETSETQAWLDYAHACGYLSKKQFSELDQIYDGVSGGLVTMMDNAERWCGPAKNPPHSHTPRLPHSKGVKEHV